MDNMDFWTEQLNIIIDPKLDPRVFVVDCDEISIHEFIEKNNLLQFFDSLNEAKKALKKPTEYICCYAFKEDNQNIYVIVDFEEEKIGNKQIK